MPRIILLLLILAALVYLVNRFRRLPAEQQKKWLLRLLIAAAAILLVTLVLTGRLNGLLAAAGALLALLPRAMRMLLGAWPAILPYFRRYQQNKQSNMHSRFIQLQIDLITGELKGTVLEGEFKGQTLQSLSQQDLLKLLAVCRQEDASSAALLKAYLDRTHSGWAGDQSASHEAPAADTSMSEQQAREILGVSATAGKDEIIHAHKKLMQKLHPDRGGSDYLAKQVNQARDVLLTKFQGNS